MQRKILICRHADTKDPFPLQPDFERELTLHGTHQARETGQWLREKFAKIDKLLASPAKRANLTARLIASKLYFEDEHITYIPDLYNATDVQLMHCLSNLPTSVNTVLLVGHNPGVTKLVRELTGKMIGYMDTAQVVCIEIDLECWEQIHYTTGTLSATTMQQV